MLSCFSRTSSSRKKNKDKAPVWDDDDGSSTEDKIYVDPPQFTLRSLMAATGNLAAKNKLGVGEGDLGPVYKGKLEDGQMVAVRRLPGRYWLSFRFHELKDQLVLAANLKHHNVVPLLGICLEQQEKLLVHEYLPNPSLHTILLAIFNKERHLDWEKRRSLILGIARALVYLHQDSGPGINYEGFLRANKVLIDDDMNPKILDAGIPPPNTDGQCVAVPDNIRRYAAPEWVRTGRASTKSDMFIFGVILLELVAGRGMYYDWCNGNMSADGLSYVWKKWNKGSIADASMGYGGYPRNEMQNYVQIGLLCVQEDLKLRPDASAVMEALETCPALLPTPSTPYLWQSEY